MIKQKIWIAAAAFLMAMPVLQAQKYFTREGKVSFFSSTPIEDIEAHNSKATSVVDAETGRTEFAVLIKAFQFEKALMQEHFNENYMESGTYPKATFKGQFSDWGSVDLAKDGTYPVEVKGDLTIHGVTNPVAANGTFTVKGGQVQAVSTFKIAVEDYGIAIPSVVRENIAKELEIRVDCNLQPLNR